MKLSSTMLPPLTACLMLVGSAALAQDVSFGAVDRDGDGFLSRDEILAVFGPSGADLLRDDRNGDGFLSRSELRGIGGDDDRGDDDRHNDDGDDDGDDGRDERDDSRDDDGDDD